jgi:hypothetical protein
VSKSRVDLKSMLDHEFVHPEPNTGCWLWAGGVVAHGYPCLRIKYKHVLGHRLSWELANGRKIPDGMHACHKCNTPRCVNPEHIFIGTAKDNMQHKVASGRSRRGERAAHAIVKLSDVIEIRALAASGMRMRDIAKLKGMRQGHVSDIARRMIWKHF